MTPEASSAKSLPAGVVLYRPNAEVLARLLECVSAEERAIFIFCNGPITPEIETRLASVPNIRIMRSATNIGLGAGLNELVHMAREAGFSYLQLYDQDSTPTQGDAARLLALYRELDGHPLPVAVVAPRLVPPEDESYLQIRYEPHPNARRLMQGSVKFAPSSGSIISMAALERIGLFRADFFIDSIDVEWCMRAWHNGFACIVADHITMTHRWGRRQAADRRAGLQILLQDPLRNFYYIRNTLHCVFLNHYPLRQKLRLLARLSAQVTVLLLRNGNDGRTWSLVSRGLSAGLKGRMGPAPPDL